MFLEVISIYYVLFQNSISNFYRNKHLSFPYSIKFIFFVVIYSVLLFKLIDYTSFCPLSWFKLVSQDGKQAKKTSKTFYVQERANLTPCFNNLFSTHKILLFSSFFFFFSFFNFKETELLIQKISLTFYLYPLEFFLTFSSLIYINIKLCLENGEFSKQLLTLVLSSFTFKSGIIALLHAVHQLPLRKTCLD